MERVGYSAYCTRGAPLAVLSSSPVADIAAVVVVVVEADAGVEGDGVASSCGTIGKHNDPHPHSTTRRCPRVKSQTGDESA